MGVDVLGSSGEVPFQDRDVDAVKNEIVKFALTPELPRPDAKALRRLLVDTKKYTWSNCAATVAVALGLRVRADVAALDEAESSERVDVLGMQNILAMAAHRYQGGDYASTLSLLARLPSRGVPTEVFLQADLLRAETYMRLNRYAEAQGLVSRLRPSLRKNARWTHVLQCLGIENTIARDKGDYSTAVAIGREAVATAETHCPAMLGGARRKLARSLALEGDWQGALAEGEKSLTEARGQGQGPTIDEAKAFLAIGEANRHGFRQDEAIKAYAQSREIALSIGHADCLLWASRTLLIVASSSVRSIPPQRS
jgi:tetratricopeptide (TPR) repeat protein